MPYDRRVAGSAFDPYARYGYVGPDRGLLAESLPGQLATGGTAPATAGRLEFAKVRLPAAASVTNIVLAASAAGTTLTAGQCFAALYSGTTFLGVTADQAASWASSGIKSMAIAGGPLSLSAGDYTVGFWYNGTTSPTWARIAPVLNALVNLGLSSPNFLCGTANTGLTTAAPSPMGAQTSASIYWWVGLS